MTLSDGTEARRKKSFIESYRQFPPVFWVANTMELFERAAYYGMMAILSVYLINNLGFSEGFPGMIMTLLLPLLYVALIGALLGVGRFRRDRLGSRGKRLIHVTFSAFVEL